MERLIDNILTDITRKNLFDNIKYLLITRDSFRKLLLEFREEFKNEYREIGKTPGRDDVREYFNVPVVIYKLDGEKEYEILEKIQADYSKVIG